VQLRSAYGDQKGENVLNKPLITIGVVVGILCLFLLFTSKFILLSGFARLEEREVTQNLERASSGMSNELAQLDTVAGDYAGWDESCRFIRDRNEAFVKTNLSNAIFPKLRLNLVLYVDLAGRIIYEKAVDPRSGKTIAAPAGLRAHISRNSLLVRHETTESKKAGVLLLPEGPLLVVSRPILTSEYKGPVRGALIMGRFLDSRETARLSGIIHLNIRIFPADDPRLPSDIRSSLNGKQRTLTRRLGSDRIAGYTIIRDIYDNPALVLEAEMSRGVYRQGVATIRYYIFSTMGIGLLAALIGYLLYTRLVISRGKQRESEAHCHAVIKQASDGIVLVDAESKRLVQANDAFLRLLGYPEKGLNDLTLYDISARDLADVDRDVEHVISHKQVNSGERRYRRKDGTLVDVEVGVSVTNGSTGRVLCLVVRDVSERSKAEEKLRLLGSAVESSINGIIVGDATLPGKPLIFVNPAVERITGFSAGEIVGNDYRRLLGSEPDHLSLEKIEKVFREPGEQQVELSSQHKDGRQIWVELSLAPVKNTEGKETHYVAVLDDITERRRIEHELSYRAAHDLLTGLPNRSLLLDRLDQAITSHNRRKKKLCVLFIDLDHFKVINDTLGHAAGDILLKKVAARLRENLRVTDTIARHGGDEFTVVLPEIEDNDTTVTLAEKVLNALTAPFMLEEREVFISASIGLTLYPDDGDTAEKLLKNADTAMYHAKAHGRSNYQFFSEKLNTRVVERLMLETSLRRALERDELRMLYQPRINLSSGRVVGVEALVRWLHPEMGILSPAKFIPLAEETGLIVPLGEWIMRTACMQSAEWKKQGLPPLHMAVNLSARQFNQHDLIDMIARIIRETDIDPTFLELELTESVIMQNAEESINKLNAIKEMGLILAIDDFGTGYSSLSYLKRFPLDTLKVDQSFVRDITSNTDDKAIVVAIIAMAHSLGLKVVAEGVETKEQKAFLLEHRCEESQGFFFSKPLTAESFSKQFNGILWRDEGNTAPAS
jgi:diguanylate cyclase (GGDEF)-like protein/PAS domain S-box-containing protein